MDQNLISGDFRGVFPLEPYQSLLASCRYNMEMMENIYISQSHCMNYYIYMKNVFFYGFLLIEFVQVKARSSRKELQLLKVCG